MLAPPIVLIFQSHRLSITPAAQELVERVRATLYAGAAALLAGSEAGDAIGGAAPAARHTAVQQVAAALAALEQLDSDAEGVHRIISCREWVNISVSWLKQQTFTSGVTAQVSTWRAVSASKSVHLYCFRNAWSPC